MSAESRSGLHVNGRITIPRDELEMRVSRSGGPGGQHVNTSSTRVEVRWNPLESRVLSEAEKERLREKLGPRLDTDGVLRVVARDYRSQHRNREAAESRLAETVRAALVIPKPRRATKPSRASREARLEDKKRASRRKEERRWRPDD